MSTSFLIISEPIPQSSKLSANMVEPDPSIDEILGLQVTHRASVPHSFISLWQSFTYYWCHLTQGEIHMSDDAIHDILEQTESDPAFQALFDLFEHSMSNGFL